MTEIIIPVEHSSVLGHEDSSSCSKRRLSPRNIHTSNFRKTSVHWRLQNFVSKTWIRLAIQWLNMVI